MTVHQPLSALDRSELVMNRNYPDWYRTLDARDAAKAAYDFHATNVYDPLDAVLDEISVRPEFSFTIMTEDGRTCRLTLGANELNKFDDHPSRAIREKAAALRSAWLRHFAARKHLGWDAASDELERLCNEQCTRERELITMPAPDFAALRWKLEHLFGAETREPGDFSPSWCAEFVNAILEDAARLMPS